MKKLHFSLLFLLLGMIHWTSVFALDLDAVKNEQPLMVRGVIKSIDQKGESFVMASNFGEIIVEVDDYDKDREIEWLRQGDRVVVFGRMDKDLFEKRSIEASTVYVQNLMLYVFVSDKDEEMNMLGDLFGADEKDPIHLQGIVMQKSNSGFLLKTSYGVILVDVSQIHKIAPYEQGLKSIDVGDRLYVEGYVDDSFFSESKIMAKNIAKVIKN